MVWFLAILATIVLAVYFRWFRWVLLGVAGIAVCGGLYLWYDSTQQEKERELSRTRIALNEIEITDLRFGSGFGGSYQLSGRIRNTSSQFHLVEVELLLRMQDCLNGNCDIVGETTESIYMRVPPGQTRGIDESVYFSSLPEPKGNFTFSYEVLSTRGE